MLFLFSFSPFWFHLEKESFLIWEPNLSTVLSFNSIFKFVLSGCILCHSIEKFVEYFFRVEGLKPLEF